MAPWTFDIKFPLGTQFTFGSLTLNAREDGDLKMLPPGPASEHPAPAPSSTLGGAYSCLDPFVGLYIRTAKLIRCIPIMTSILRPFARASCSSSSASSPVETRLMTTLRSRPAPMGTPQKTSASSLWWPQTGISPTIALADIPLLGDQRCLMPELLALPWFKI
jgi:hypothetical protein